MGLRSSEALRRTSALGNHRPENGRSPARIIVVMASIVVLLAVAGVYGVLSFTVSQRTREFGIRMVLGVSQEMTIVIWRGVSVDNITRRECPQSLKNWSDLGPDPLDELPNPVPNFRLLAPDRGERRKTFPWCRQQQLKDDASLCPNMDT